MTAVGQITTREGFLQRLLDTGVAPTPAMYPLVDSIVAAGNQWLQTVTGRVLGPIPTFDSTFSGTAGNQYITLTSATGLSVGDDLLLGPLYGLHEAWSVMSIAENLSLAATSWAALTAKVLGNVVQPTSPNGHTYLCVTAGTTGASQPTFPTDGSAVIDGTVVWLDQGLTDAKVYLTGQLANTYSGAVCQAIYIQDGVNADDEGYSLVVERGIVTLAALEIAPYSGGQFSVAEPQDWYLRPSGPDLQPGWPFTEIVWTNVPTGTTYPVFYPGFSNIRLIGPGPCVAAGMPSATAFGWPTAPGDAADVGYKWEMADFRVRSGSGGATFTVNLDGSRTYENALSYQDQQTIERYRVKSVLAIGGLYGN